MLSLSEFASASESASWRPAGVPGLAIPEQSDGEPTQYVLAGASAGVIGVDVDSCISILNRSAEQLIGCSEADALGRPLTEIVPELADMFTAARSGVQRLVQGQVTINRNGRERNLSVRVTSEQSGAGRGARARSRVDHARSPRQMKHRVRAPDGIPRKPGWSTWQDRPDTDEHVERVRRWRGG